MYLEKTLEITFEDGSVKLEPCLLNKSMGLINFIPYFFDRGRLSGYSKEIVGVKLLDKEENIKAA